MIRIKTPSHKRRLTGLSSSIKKKVQKFEMATKGADMDIEKVKMSLEDGDNLEDSAKETDEELNSK